MMPVTYTREWSAIVVLSTIAMGAPAAHAQSVSRDPATGDYVVTYQVDGSTYQARTEASDLVDPRLAIGVTIDSVSRVRYTYTVTNMPSPQEIPGHGIMVVDLVCSPSSEPSFDQSPEWLGDLEVNGSTTVCDLTRKMSHLQLEPGDPASIFVVSSEYLPGIVRAKVHGSAGLPIVPTNEVDTPDEVYRLLERYGGYGFDDSSGVSLMTLGPVHAPAAFGPPGRGLDVILADLDLACGALEWIDDGGICNSIRQKLGAAQAALQRDNVGAARGSLAACVSELVAQRGKHVSDEAYWLIKTNVSYVLAHM